MKRKFTKFFSRKNALLIAGISLAAGFSNSITAQTYCTPTYSTGCSGGDDIKDVILNGASGTMISHLNTPCPTGSYQNNYTSTTPNMTATLIMGSSYSGNVTTNYAFGNESVKVWIDFNHNGTFEATEVVATLDNISSTSVGAINVTIPMTALSGDTRMRVRLVYQSTAASIDPCNSATWGETQDYKVTIMPPAPPNNAGVGSLNSPTAAFCSNSMAEVSVNVVNYGSNQLDNAIIKWSVNGVMQPNVNFATVLPFYMDSTVAVLGQVHFPTTAPLTIKAWTEMPNGVVDTDNSDDTLNTSASASLQGVEIVMNQGDTTICQGGSVILDAGTHPLNPIYVWSNGQLTQSITVSTPGYYSVFVQNNIGCFDEATVNLSVHPNPVANSIAINDLGNGSFQFGILGGYNIDTYNWNFGDGTQQSGGSTMTKQYATSGEYTVTVTMSNQCGEITIVRVLAVVVGNGTGVNDLKGLANDLKMYPNPGRDKVTITHNGGIKMKHVELYSLMGQKVYSEAVNAEKQEINISNLASGIYNVVIDTDKGKATKKLEVIR